MDTIEIKQTTEGDIVCYSFTSRGVAYDVMTTDHNSFDVWSHRQSLPRTSATIRANLGLAQLAKISKVMRNVAALIQPAAIAQ